MGTTQFYPDKTCIPQYATDLIQSLAQSIERLLETAVGFELSPLTLTYHMILAALKIHILDGTQYS